MRKYQQTQLLELVQTLNEANAELERLFSHKEYDAVMQLLMDSQGFVVQMGEYIETIAGEGTQTVTLLEEYYDDLYRVSVEIEEGVLKPNFTKQLIKKTTSIEASIKAELKPNKTEVVFLPYKASMWDSLESVWQAAMDDPQCDAVVVPIPYYEKGSGASAGTMYCEHDLYPDYVPVVSWQEYDMKLRHPDVVYIHYPYDDMTQNSSVHPNFFTENIREYCDLIVYIPYYVNVDSNVPDYNGYLPGIVNSDYVIVQSDEVRQAYTTQYNKYYITHRENKNLRKPEEKFIALGSPKFDKVLSSEKEDFELPDDWKNFIYKADGSTKKVILYNTHMFRWIEGGEHYFKKLRDIFNTFSDRDDVVLWWRPHPNTELNFRVLRPNLLDEYYRTVDEYRNIGFGIYDDTPDLHRAIVWSDAYYGDWSSLVTMYQAISKPVMIQSVIFYVRLLYADNAELVFAYNKYKGSIAFSYDYKTTNASILTKNDMFALFQYTYCYKHSDYYYFSPYCSDSIIRYNNKTKTSNTYDLPERALTTNENNGVRLLDIFNYDSYIYYTPFCYPGIVRQSISSGELDVIDDFITQIKTLGIAATQKGFTFDHATMCSNKLIFPVKEFSIIVVFDMQAGTSRIVQPDIGEESKGCAACCCENKRLWILSLDQRTILRWDIECEQSDIFTLIPEKLHSGNDSNLFSDMFYLAGYIYLIARDSNYSLKINLETDEVKIAEELSFDSFSPGINFITSHVIVGDDIYFVTGSNEWYKVTVNDCNLQKNEIKILNVDRAAIYNIYSDVLYSSGLVEDLPEFGIIEYLRFVVSESRTVAKELQLGIRNNSGIQIYEYIKNKLTDGMV